MIKYLTNTISNYESTEKGHPKSKEFFRKNNIKNSNFNHHALLSSLPRLPTLSQLPQLPALDSLHSLDNCNSSIILPDHPPHPLHRLL